MKLAWIALALLSFLFTACNTASATRVPASEATITPEPSPTATSIPSEIVTFTTEDNANLAGTLFGSGKVAVILAYQGRPGADQTTWQPFARLIVERGYTALTFDFRGVGQSKGVLRYGDLEMDVKAAAQFLRGHGYNQIVCAGANMGGTACIYNAVRDEYTGLIILASTMMAGSGNASLRITDDDLSKLALPKLFITTENDYSTVVSNLKHMAELSPDPKSLLLLPGTQHDTNLFNTDSGEKITASLFEFLDSLPRESGLPTKLEGTTGPIYSLAWSPDGHVLASAGYGQVKLWDGITRKEIATLEGHASYVWGLVWSPDGSTLATANQDGTVRLWDSAAREKIAVLKTEWAFWVSGSPDGKLLTGVCYKNTIPAWDPQTGQLVQTRESSSVQEVAVAFSPNRKQIATGGFTDNIRLWDSATGRWLQTITPPPFLTWELSFDPNGDRLASANFDVNRSGTSGISLGDTSVGKLFWNYKPESTQPLVLSVDYSPDGKKIAFGTFNSALILGVETGALIQSLSIPNHVGDLAFSPDGTLLATASEDHKIRLWSMDDFELAATLEGHAHHVNGEAFNPNGKLVISGSHDKKVGVWEVESGQRLNMLEGHEAEVLRVAVSPSRLIETISRDGTVRLWGVTR